jgi:hypothetical protein
MNEDFCNGEGTSVLIYAVKELLNPNGGEAL